MANDIYVTVAGAGDNSGSSWANAMSVTDWETDLEAPASADDRYWVEEGTYTLTEAIDCSAINGTSTQPIMITGVVSGTTNEPPLTSDWAYANNRPLIAAAGNAWWFGDYWVIRNLRVTTTETWGFRVDAYGVLFNCSSVDTGGSWSITLLGAYAICVGCEAEANTGGIYTAGTSRCVASYIHDGTGDGSQLAGPGVVFINNIFDTMGIALDINSRANVTVIGNTIYNCTTGLSGTTSHQLLLVNNIIDACTTGATWTTAYYNHFVDYNCWDNTTDVSNITKGPHAVTADPGMNDPANADFSIDTGDNADNAGLDVGDLTGATV